MSQHERNGFRDDLYSEWHRSSQIRQYLGLDAAVRLSMIDLDVTLWVEYRGIRYPLVLIETALDRGQEEKPSTVTRQLAIMAGLPAFCVLYRVEEENGQRMISGFRVQQIAPARSREWVKMDPRQYARFLLMARSAGLAAMEERIATTKAIAAAAAPFLFDPIEAND